MRFQACAARQSLSGTEGILLGSLLLVAFLVMLLDTLLGEGSFSAYLFISLIFLSSASVYTVCLYCHHPNAVNLWSIFFLFYILFFSAGGILGVKENFL